MQAHQTKQQSQHRQLAGLILWPEMLVCNNAVIHLLVVVEVQVVEVVESHPTQRQRA
jgi:hypothetical protein